MRGLFTSDHVLAMAPRMRSGLYSFRQESVARIAKNNHRRRESAVNTAASSRLAAQL